jgi:xanthine dehydrogenase small subunit
MRDQLLLYVNGQRLEVRGETAFASLTDFLRGDLRLTGTKVVCAEGDCGACTVLVGHPDGEGLRYMTVDACIQFLYQLDGRHVVTVEGLGGAEGKLHPVQEAMVACHGSQCGFCTPGFVMALAGRAELRGGLGTLPSPPGIARGEGSGVRGDSAPAENRSLCEGRLPPSPQPGSPAKPGGEGELRTSLTGNLCRCTGYVAILEAATAIDECATLAIADQYPVARIAADLRAGTAEPVRIESKTSIFFAPTTLEAAVDFKARNPGAAIVAGGTELGVVRNKAGLEPAAILRLGNVPELDRIDVTDETVTIGANVTWTAVEEFAKETWPEFYRIVIRFGSPQIRNVATMIANIANGSPIADSLPFLAVMEAELELVGSTGARTVKLADFYRGYKVKDLRPDEIITHVRIPQASSGETMKLYKVSRRNDLDIATFGAAIRIRVAGDVVRRAYVAYGGVAATIVRLPRTEAWLQGKPWEFETFAEAGRIARSEIAPISDVRGSKDFRWQLAENIFVKFFYELADEVTV